VLRNRYSIARSRIEDEALETLVYAADVTTPNTLSRMTGPSPV